MSTITKSDIIQRAIGLYNSSNHIDIIKLAQGLGIDIFPHDEPDFNARIRYQEDLKKFYIKVNPNHVTTRQRFSIAHELAHYVLHRNKVEENGAVDRDNDWSLDASEEKAADKLAAQILMPEPIVKEYVENNNLDGTKPLTEHSVRKIAEYFKVSLMTAILRLKEVGYHVSWISFS